MAKATKPMVRIHNQETDEVIDREMNDAELLNIKHNKQDMRKSKPKPKQKKLLKQQSLIVLA